MPLLIDGNNLQYAANDVGTSDLLIGRSMLCSEIGAWAKRRDQRVHIVFDGPVPSAQRAEQIGDPAIEVSFSGAGVSADAVIARIVETDSAARRLLVVSSDREVAHAARRRQARVVRSDEFWTMLRRDLARPEPEHVEPEEKETGSSPAAAQQWLDEFGLT